MFGRFTKRFSGLKRSVTKMVDGGRHIGKQIGNINRMVTKKTGVDVMKMMYNKGREMVGKENMQRINDAYAGAMRMKRQVEGGDYQGAGNDVHNYMRKHSGKYDDYYTRARNFQQRYG